MKKDWTYKKLGEVAEIEYGTRVVQKKDGGSIYPVYGGGGATFKMDTYNREDRLVIARFAMSPKCTRFVSGKFFLNDSGLTLKANDCLFTPYLNWHIIALNDEIYHTAKGAAQKNLDVKAFTSLKIAIPPLSIQRSIVAELDLLHSVISKKKEQLRELDNLAQSLFYQMFGDPITNPMGWEVKKLGEVCTLSQGLAINAGTKHLIVPKSTIPLLRIQDLKSGNREIFIDDKNYPQNCLAQVDDIIYTRTGTLGFVFTGNYGIVHNNCFRIFPNYTVLNKQFFMYYIGSSSFRDMIIGLAQRSSQPDITHSLFKKQTIILPPLSLQHSFAAKIEAIDAQKQAVQQSIREVEALLAERMDNYFS